jgi:carbon storage regulator CsrA
MLVLTRRVGEEVVLPGVRVRFTVLAVSGGRIRVGVTAPTALEVLRGELSDGGAGDDESGFRPALAAAATRRKG